MLLSVVPLTELDQLDARMRQVFRQLAAHGITSASFVLQTDAEGLAGAAGELESVGMMLFIEQLAIGAHTLLCGDPARALDARTSSALHEPHRNHVVGGVKLWCDGTLTARTAYLREPYADAPDRRGWLTVDLATAAERMETAHLAGLQICAKTVGDAAVAAMLDLFADLAARHPAPPGGAPRHRISHVSVLEKDTAERMAELGLTAVVSPPLLRTVAPFVCNRLGPERTPHAYPFRTLADAGVVLAGASSAPSEGTNVLVGMGAAMTRYGLEPAQGLTAAETVEMYTHGGAVAQERDHLVGRIAEGMQADLVVLSADPTAVRPDLVPGIDVELTVVGGRVVHHAVDDLRPL